MESKRNGKEKVRERERNEKEGMEKERKGKERRERKKQRIMMEGNEKGKEKGNGEEKEKEKVVNFKSTCGASTDVQGAVGVVVSHPLSMREAPGSIPGLSIVAFSVGVLSKSRQL